MNEDQVKGYLIKLLKDEKLDSLKIKELIEKLDILMTEIKPEQIASYYYEINEI